MRLSTYWRLEHLSSQRKWCPRYRGPAFLDAELPGVLCASLEHVVPSCKVSVTAGGLSKVLRMQLMHALQNPDRQYHFVFPMVGDQDYSGFDKELPPLQNGAARTHAL